MTKRSKLNFYILSTLLACALIIGHSFENAGNLSLALSLRDMRILRSLFLFVGLSVLFYLVLTFCADRLKNRQARLFAGHNDARIGNRISRLFRAHPFLFVLIVLIIAYIPYIIASYPGILLGDDFKQISQWRLADTPLTTHHPLAHTALLNLCLTFGLRLFKSGNAGLFLYCILQMLFLFSAIAYVCDHLYQALNIPGKFIAVIVLYFILSPRIQNYIMVVTKDVFYSACMLYYLIFFHAICTGDRRRKTALGWILSGAGIFLFRNEGRYILLFSFILILLLCGKALRKHALIGIVATLCAVLISGSVVLPMFHAVHGSKREMLSIPFQQTARYVRDAGDEVTPAEHEAIDRVLEYDSLAEGYDPNRSDNVKNTFREDSTPQDLRNYFNTWWKMFKKHPRIYIEATLHNYYQYLYPTKELMRARGYRYSAERMQIDNEAFSDIGLVFSYPSALAGYRSTYASIRESVAHFPVFSPLISAALYSWMVLFLLFYAIRHRNKTCLAYLALPLGALLICFLGPCNGFFCRYSYPLMITAPLLVIGTIHLVSE